MQLQKKILLALDFDNTIITHSKVWQISTQPLFPQSKIPEDLAQIKKDEGWDAFVRASFKELFKIGVKREDISKCLSSQPLLPGMGDLLRWAKEEVGADTIVISDSFKLNVWEVLRANGLDHLVSDVFSNEASFSDEGELVFPDDDPGRKRCSFSQRGTGLCKGGVLSDYWRDKDYDFVCFVGDGKNDICACVHLRKDRGDLALARRGFPLATLLDGHTDGEMADAEEWSDGDDVREAIQKRIRRGSN